MQVLLRYLFMCFCLVQHGLNACPVLPAMNTIKLSLDMGHPSMNRYFVSLQREKQAGPYIYFYRAISLQYGFNHQEQFRAVKLNVFNLFRKNVFTLSPSIGLADHLVEGRHSFLAFPGLDLKYRLQNNRQLALATVGVSYQKFLSYKNESLQKHLLTVSIALGLNLYKINPPKGYSIGKRTMLFNNNY